MNILFLQKDVFEKPAIMLLSAILKKGGHQCDVLIDDLEKDMVKRALKINPDIIAFSITTGESAWMNKIGKKIRKKFKKLIICGGPHATFYPAVINEDYLDVICIGEGERAILDLVNALERDKDITKIKNLIVKKDGKVYKNELRPLISDLDSIPFLDRTFYGRYDFFFRNQKNKFTGNTGSEALMETSRGCPFRCSFCFNKIYSEIYNGKGKIIRRRSVSNAIKEIKEIKKRNPNLKFIDFVDDVFTLPPRAWLNNFLERYKMEINIPFTCTTRSDLIDEDIIKKLKDANCVSTKIGIESGNENIRNNILNKGVTNQQIIKAANLIKKYGIKLQTFNMLGTPGETLDTAFETFELNKKISPTYAWCSLLNPYPGTEIFKYAVENNYLDENFDFKNIGHSFFITTPIEMKNKKEICNLQKIFSLCVFLHLPKKLVKFLIKLPFTKLYELIFGICLIMGLSKIHRANLLNLLKVSYLSKHVLKHNKNIIS